MKWLFPGRLPFILAYVNDQAESQLASYLHVADALYDAMNDAVAATDPTDVWRFASYKTFMRKYNELLSWVTSIEAVHAPVDTYNLENVPSNMNTIAMQQQDLFEDVRANLAILRAYLRNRVNPKIDQIVGIADFLEANLRRAVLERPEKERDVQDVVEQLLIGRGMDKGLHYDRESGRVKVSAKEVVPDFVLLQLNTAIEVKLAKDKARVGPAIDEINADIQAYGKSYDAVVFVIYDTGGSIRDDAEFKRDLEANDGVRVLLVKH